MLTRRAVEQVEDDDEYRRLLDSIGVGLPVRELAPLNVGARGVLGAAASGDHAVFERLAEGLARDGHVLLDLLGPDAADHGVWARICAEGRQLLPHMTPGILESADGTVTKGKAPSGRARGDVYIASSEAAQRRAWPALALLDAALAAVGHALAPALAAHPALGHRIRLRTDPFFKCFPGHGAEYGAHYDGGRVAEATKLTAVLYCNERWEPAAGGQLRLLDEARGCWRAVTPHAGRLVLFLVDGCLHKVMPCHATRFALTNWWLEPNYRPGDPTDVSVTVRSAHQSGPQRYERVAPTAARDTLRALDAMARRA